MQDSVLSTFNFDDVIEYLDLSSSFRFMLISLSNDKVAIATSRHLLIMEDMTYDNNVRREKIQTVVEFGEASGRPTALQWLSHDVLCIGFEKGGLACFNNAGETLVDHEFTNCPLVSIRVSYSEDQVVGPVVWALYENGYLVSVPVEHLLAGGGIGRYYLKFKLIGHTEVNDVILLPSAHVYSIFDESSNASTSLVVGGINPTLSLYSIGGKQHFQHLGKLASFVRERVGTAITKTVGSALNSFFGGGGGTDKVDDEIDHTSISSVLDFDDPKRRIIRLSIDPYGKLIAAADGIGRVLLFDVRFAVTAIRIWKGVRDARVAWTEDRKNSNFISDANKSNKSGLDERDQEASSHSRSCLCLALFAPLTGLLTLWAMRHGPCLRSIPVGAQCHISTILDSLLAKDSRQYRCALFRVTGNKVTMTSISPFGHSDEDLDVTNITSSFPDDIDEGVEMAVETDTTSKAPEVNELRSNTEDIKSLQNVENMIKLLMKEKKLHTSSTSSTLASDSNSSNSLVALEHKIWIIISGMRHLDTILKCFQLIERLEIDIYTLGKSHNPMDGVSVGFSLQFHRNLCRVYEEGAKHASDRDYHQGQSESRTRLVKAYELLCEISSQTNLTSLSSMPAPGTEKNKWMKQNGGRAEALAWAARKLSQASPSNSGTSNSFVEPKLQRSLTLTGSEGKAKFDDSSSIDLSTSQSNRGAFDGQNNRSPLPHSPLLMRTHSLSDANTPPSSVNSNPASSPYAAYSSPVPPFAVFLHFNLENTVDALYPTISTFKFDYFCDILEEFNETKVGYQNSNHYTFQQNPFNVFGKRPKKNLSEISSSTTSNTNAISDLKKALFTGVDPSSWRPPSWVAQEILNFFFIPLLGDVFNLQRFQTAMDIIGLGGGTGLMKTLPLFFAFIEVQPLQIIFNSLINRQMSSSPFQRWLRDTLLAFQPFLSGDNESAEGQASTAAGDMAGSTTDADNEMEERVSLAQLLTSVIDARIEVNGKDDISGDAAISDSKASPTIDEVVRYILRPAWKHTRNSVHLECMMIVSAQVVEVLEAVSDQLERRTLGDITLNMTIKAWLTIIRELRVTLLLSSRAGGTLSINRLGRGDISIYSLLAEDTLCFALQAEQVMALEIMEQILTLVQAIEHETRCQEVFDRRSNTTPSMNSSASAARPSPTSESAGALLAWGSSADARWKELVAVAEAEDAMNSGEVTSAVGSKSSKESMKKIRRRRPLLLFFPSHNQASPLAAYRSFALVHRWFRRPKRVEILALATTHLASLPPLTRATVCERAFTLCIMPLLRAFLDLEEGQAGRGQSSLATQEIMVVMADFELVEQFVKAVSEFINYSFQGNIVNSSTSNSNHDRTSLSPWKGSTRDEHDISEYEDESLPAVWPPGIDVKLTSAVKNFQMVGISEGAAKWHLCLLLVLQLRTQCGLRGIKPSALFSSSFLASACQHADSTGDSYRLGVWTRAEDGGHTGESGQSESGDLRRIREEFILQCFRRLESKPAHTVYAMAAIWNFDPQPVKLLHLTTLLELGLDELIGELISQFDSMTIVDRISQGIKQRVGNCTSVLERIPACGALLASLDPDALAWVRSGASAPDRNAIDNIFKGKSKVINFDVQSTRFLVVRIQAVLLAVPLAQRDEEWMNRKGKCDYLLSLCTTLSPHNIQVALKGSGLMI